MNEWMNEWNNQYIYYICAKHINLSYDHFENSLPIFFKYVLIFFLRWVL